MPTHSEAEEFDFRAALLESLPHLRAFARSLTRNPDLADDLVHEAVARALAASEQFTPGTNFRAWIFTILRHHYYNDSRKWHSRAIPLEGEAETAQHTAPPQQAHMEFSDFRRAFWQLPPDQREVLILVGASGLSYEQAAEVCGCRLGTIKSRVSRARTELKRILDEDKVILGRAEADQEGSHELIDILKDLS
ncbi:MAG TPA: sigma-70 family RNA polymerase sigma factor [Terriglobia bacterium]|nr:sigma-70 family RNA polymerase sigma factor [Terriglobia bacterium]